MPVIEKECPICGRDLEKRVAEVAYLIKNINVYSYICKNKNCRWHSPLFEN